MARRNNKRPDFPSARDLPEDERVGRIEQLVEPEGDVRTYYAPTLDAMANKLNTWHLINGRIDDARDRLFTLLREATQVATELDRLVEDANAD